VTSGGSWCALGQHRSTQRKTPQGRGTFVVTMAPEFVAKAVQEWITAVGAMTAYIEPGSNGSTTTSRASTRLRDELPGRGDSLFAKGGSDRDRELAMPLQCVRPHEPLGYRPAGSACPVAVCTLWACSGCHAPAAVET
jgi:hypothetical protein